ncbi:MAG: hypothetical protein HYZ53_18170 [Planctomycetes bacterium]|nr:hypothetical protein [Planctomycetota bacterium]
MEAWGPRAFKGHSFQAHPHQGMGALPDDFEARPDPKRRGLLDLLPATLRAYADSAASRNDAVLVLVDADDKKCEVLLSKLLALAESLSPRPNLVFRLAIEETEAFYLGDLRALRSAFPNADMSKANAYVPDSICDTAELFGQIVGDGGMNKVWWAEEMGPRVTTKPSHSRSPSFRKLHAGIVRLLKPSAGSPRKQRRFRHVARSARRRG